jgi:hypothetical protein
MVLDGRLPHTLLNDRYEVVVHARNRDRLTAVRDLLDQGAVVAPYLTALIDRPQRLVYLSST